MGWIGEWGVKEGGTGGEEVCEAVLCLVEGAGAGGGEKTYSVGNHTGQL